MVNKGTVSIRKGSTIGYLKQIPDSKKENTIIKDILYESVAYIKELENKLREYEHKIATYKGKELDKILNKYARIQEEYINLGGYELDSKINKLINGFNIENLIYKEYNTLSGGEKVRLKLFELIQNNNNFLILDEPTNHIDIYTKEILEESLKEYTGTILFISHDRYFINKLANKILYIENKIIKEYIGNYNDLVNKL